LQDMYLLRSFFDSCIRLCQIVKIGELDRTRLFPKMLDCMTF